MQEAELLLELIAAILGHPVACFLASTRCSLVSSSSLHARAVHSLARMSPTPASASAMPANFNLCLAYASHSLANTYARRASTRRELASLVYLAADLYCNFLRCRRHRYNLLSIDLSLPQKSARSSRDVMD